MCSFILPGGAKSSVHDYRAMTLGNLLDTFGMWMNYRPHEDVPEHFLHWSSFFIMILSHDKIVIVYNCDTWLPNICFIWFRQHSQKSPELTWPAWSWVGLLLVQTTSPTHHDQQKNRWKTWGLVSTNSRVFLHSLQLFLYKTNAVQQFQRSVSSVQKHLWHQRFLLRRSQSSRLEEVWLLVLHCCATSQDGLNQLFLLFPKNWIKKSQTQSLQPAGYL